MKIINKLFIVCILWLPLITLSGCEKFLDVKPQMSLAIPETLEDLNAMLNNTQALNEYGPAIQQIATDDHYYTSDYWNGLTTERFKDGYIWEPYVQITGDYNNCYSAIGICNEVLSSLERIGLNEQNTMEWNRLRATALFFRGFHVLQAAHVFAAPYGSKGEMQLYGLPIPEKTGLEQKFSRKTIEETYAFILSDLTEAVKTLPNATTFKTLPTLAAGYSILARVYLYKQDYPAALQYAKKALEIHAELLDYNTINGNAAIPFQRFNNEVIFHSTMLSSSQLAAPASKVDTILFSTYKSNDLRKTHFFVRNPDTTYSFKGNYNGTNASSLFTGTTTAEMYLVCAEAAARINQLNEAENNLNALLKKRVKQGTFQAVSFSSQSEAIYIILSERRKELIYRGQRWADLRRYNLDENRQVVLRRMLNSTLFELKPGDNRYIFLLPDDVVAFNPYLVQAPR